MPEPETLRPGLEFQCANGDREGSPSFRHAATFPFQPANAFRRRAISPRPRFIALRQRRNAFRNGAISPRGRAIHLRRRAMTLREDKRETNKSANPFPEGASASRDKGNALPAGAAVLRKTVLSLNGVGAPLSGERMPFPRRPNHPRERRNSSFQRAIAPQKVRKRTRAR